jgi:hypothetical protein
MVSPVSIDGARDLATVPLRSPDQVMRLARLGSFHPTRLSFMRVLLRRLAAENWRFDRPQWRIDARGEGVAIYRARGPQRTYSLVCFGHDLPPEKRTDRVIAEEWDATFALHDGEPTDADITRLAANVPRQEAGRCSARELVMARANRSVRLFDHVVECLSGGRQPSAAALAAVGYLMRTTAVYGSGKFGLADRERICERPEFAAPFQSEMLAVFLIRAFTLDIAEHMARLQAPGTAVPLRPDLRRSLGVGNATGLGMAPFLVNHPALLHHWIGTRETALARVRALPHAGRLDAFSAYLRRANQLVTDWRVDDPIQTARIVELACDLVRLQRRVAEKGVAGPLPWDALFRWAEQHLGLEAQEMLVSLLLEPHGDIVDDLSGQLACDEDAEFAIDGAMTIGALAAAIRRAYHHALALDFERPEAQARFWYVSEEKLEPRLGERSEEPGAEREQPLAVARDVAALYHAVGRYPADTPVAALLMAEPGHRHVVRRVQMADRHPYAEIRDNLIDAAMRPIDLLRCKLACFGATRFDPKSDRWTRITLFQNAPFPDDIGGCDPDDWMLPPLSAEAAA